MKDIKFEEIGNLVLINKKMFYSILKILKEKGIDIKIIKCTGDVPKIQIQLLSSVCQMRLIVVVAQIVEVKDFFLAQRED